MSIFDVIIRFYSKVHKEENQMFEMLKYSSSVEVVTWIESLDSQQATHLAWTQQIALQISGGVINDDSSRIIIRVK